MKTLLALFKAKDEFADENAAAEFLSTLKSPTDAHILPMILTWAKEIYNKLCAKLNKGPLAASTPDDLADMGEPYIQSAENPIIELEGYESLECCVWPFIRLAR